MTRDPRALAVLGHPVKDVALAAFIGWEARYLPLIYPYWDEGVDFDFGDDKE